MRLARGKIPEALGSAREAMDLLESLGDIEQGETVVRLAHAEALHAPGDAAGARAAIALAKTRLLGRADKIRDPVWRTSFLERIADHARILELARAWAG